MTGPAVDQVLFPLPEGVTTEDVLAVLKAAGPCLYQQQPNGEMRKLRGGEFWSDTLPVQTTTRRTV